MQISAAIIEKCIFQVISANIEHNCTSKVSRPMLSWLSVAEHTRVDMHRTKIDYRFKTKINKLTSDITSLVFQLTLKYRFIMRNDIYYFIGGWWIYKFMHH